jgi:hypothetical protein
MTIKQRNGDAHTKDSTHLPTSSKNKAPNQQLLSSHLLNDVKFFVALLTTLHIINNVTNILRHK